MERFYLGPLLTAAGVTDTNAQLVINIALSAWFFVTGLIGTIIIEKFPRRLLFSIPHSPPVSPYPNYITISLNEGVRLILDLSNIAMIPLLALIGVLTKRASLVAADNC